MFLNSRFLNVLVSFSALTACSTNHTHRNPASRKSNIQTSCLDDLRHLLEQKIVDLDALALFTQQDDAFQLNLGNSLIVRFVPRDSWGLPKNLAGRMVTVRSSVKNLEEGYKIFKALVEAGPPEWKSLINEPKEGRVTFAVNGILEGEVRKVGDCPESVCEASYELVINVNKENQHALLHQKNLFEAFQRLGLKKIQAATLMTDLSTNSGRREWAYYSFLNWARSLNQQQVDALRKISGPHYREIHNYLLKGLTKNQLTFYKDQEATLEAVYKRFVDDVDSAIKAGKVNREVYVYRSDANPALFEVWNAVNSQAAPREVFLPISKAYTFTSLDPEMAVWWNRSELSGKGILLKIKVPEGSNAAYIDAEGVQTERGYLELLLARNSRFKVTAASELENGQKLLEVEFQGR